MLSNKQLEGFVFSFINNMYSEGTKTTSNFKYTTTNFLS